MTTLAAILAEYGVEVMPPNGPARGPRQTHAGKTLEKLHRDYGEDHVRDVLTAILESENNIMALVAPVILAVSDVLITKASWWQRDASAFLEVMDRADLVELYEAAKRHRRQANKPRAGVYFALCERLEAVFGPAREPTLFDRQEERA